MAVMDSIRAIGHGIGWLIPGVQEAQAMEASTNAHRQQAVRNKIDEYRTRELAQPQPDNPEWHQRVNLLNELSQQAQEMGPFDNPKKIHQRLFDEYESMHPAAYGQPSQPPQPPQAVPGPAMQGQPQGQPNIIPSVPSIGDVTGGVVGNGIPSVPPISAASVGTSKIQPSQQQGGGAAQTVPSPFPQIPEPPSITGIGDTGAGANSQPVFKAGATALGPPPELTLPPRPSYQLPPPSLEHNTYEQLATAMRESQQPYIQAQAAVEQALNTLRGTQEYQMANGPRRLGMVQQMMGPDVWNRLSDLAKTEIATSAMNMPIPGIGGLFVPHTISSNVLGSDILTGNPDARDPRGNPIDPKQRYNIKLIGGQEVYEAAGAQTHQVFDYDPNTKKFYSVTVDQSGRETGRFETVPPAGYRPTITYNNGIRLVTQPDNTIQAVPIRTSSERVPDLAALGGSGGGQPGQPTPGVTGPGTTVGAVPPNQATPAAQPAKTQQPTAPTASVAGPGKTVGGKGITPQERIGWEQKLGAATSALEIVKDIRRELPLVQSMIQAKKIDLSIDPNQGLIVHRLLPLNDEEAKLAGDLESMREHINVLRQPLGASGFRSEDAWSALQAMFGGLGLNPKVADQIIQRTVQSMNRQINAIGRGLKGQHDFPTDYTPVTTESAKETKPLPNGSPSSPPNLSSTAQQYLKKKGKL